MLKQEIFELFQGLALFWLARQAEIGIIIEVAYARGSILCQLFLVDVLIDDTAGAVHKHGIGHFGQKHVTRACTCINTETDLQVFRFQTIHFDNFYFTDGLLLHIGKIRNIAWLNLTEVFVNQLNNLIRIKVARHSNTIVVGHIIGLEMLVDVR